MLIPTIVVATPAVSVLSSCGTIDKSTNKTQQNNKIDNFRTAFNHMNWYIKNNCRIEYFFNNVKQSLLNYFKILTQNQYYDYTLNQFNYRLVSNPFVDFDFEVEIYNKSFFDPNPDLSKIYDTTIKIRMNHVKAVPVLFESGCNQLSTAFAIQNQFRLKTLGLEDELIMGYDTAKSNNSLKWIMNKFNNQDIFFNNSTDNSELTIDIKTVNMLNEQEAFSNSWSFISVDDKLKRVSDKIYHNLSIFSQKFSPLFTWLYPINDNNLTFKNIKDINDNYLN